MSNLNEQDIESLASSVAEKLQDTVSESLIPEDPSDRIMIIFDWDPDALSKFAENMKVLEADQKADGSETQPQRPHWLQPATTVRAEWLGRTIKRSFIQYIAQGTIGSIMSETFLVAEDLAAFGRVITRLAAINHDPYVQAVAFAGVQPGSSTSPRGNDVSGSSQQRKPKPPPTIHGPLASIFCCEEKKWGATRMGLLKFSHVSYQVFR